MVKEQLENLLMLREEAEHVRQRIHSLEENRRNIENVTDVVRGSSQEFPYTSHSVKICGYDAALAARIDRSIAIQRSLLYDRLEDIMLLEQAVTEYVNTIQDPEIRMLIEMRYIDGMAWESIGKLVHRDRTTCSKKVSRFLECEENEKSFPQIPQK